MASRSCQACGSYTVAGSIPWTSSTASIRATPPVAGASGSAASTVTQRRPPATASDCGLPPTRIVSTFRVAGSTRLTVPSRAFATQTEPSPTVTPSGNRPTPIEPTTACVVGLIRTSVSSSASTTQTPPSPTATAAGLRPTGIVVRSPVASTRVTVSA